MNRLLYDLALRAALPAMVQMYCVVQAPSEALIREHAARSGFPANRITPIAAVIDPTTAGRR